MEIRTMHFLSEIPYSRIFYAVFIWKQLLNRGKGISNAIINIVMETWRDSKLAKHG